MTLLITLLACGDKDPGTHDSPTTDDSGTPAENQAPGAPSISLSPEEPRSSEDLLCQIDVDSVDPDGDEVSYSYAWSEEGVDLGVDSATLPGDARTPWTEVSCTVTPSDGELEGDSAQASTTSRDACVSVSFSHAGGYLLPDQQVSDFVMDEGDFTLEAWVKPSQSEEDQVLFARGGTTPPRPARADQMPSARSGRPMSS